MLKKGDRVQSRRDPWHIDLDPRATCRADERDGKVLVRYDAGGPDVVEDVAWLGWIDWFTEAANRAPGGDADVPVFVDREGGSR